MCSIFVDASAGTLSCRLPDVVERLIGLDGTMRGVRLGRLAYKALIMGVLMLRSGNHRDA
jgi:hypothetical protein